MHILFQVLYDHSWGIYHSSIDDKYFLVLEITVLIQITDYVLVIEQRKGGLVLSQA